MALIHEKINYIELPSNNFDKTKLFFETVFNWKFEEYGEDYLAFFDGTIDGGFYQSDLAANHTNGGALIVFYSEDLEQTQEKIISAKGSIIKPTFSFPGGRRFHFTDLTNNEYAIWSNKDPK